MLVIHQIVDGRPTYYCRRIEVLVNGKVGKESLAIVELKRGHRIMSNHQLQLSWHTPLRDGRRREDKIMITRVPISGVVTMTILDVRI